MSKLYFNPISGRAEDIIQTIMDTPEVQSVPDLEFTLRLVVEEIIVNIVNYAYPEGADGEVSVDVSADDTEIILVFSDKGAPFNPLEKEDPDVTLDVADRPIGGLGIFLVKQTMDNVAYRYEDGSNIFIISKKK